MFQLFLRARAHNLLGSRRRTKGSRRAPSSEMRRPIGSGSVPSWRRLKPHCRRRSGSRPASTGASMTHLHVHPSPSATALTNISSGRRSTIITRIFLRPTSPMAAPAQGVGEQHCASEVRQDRNADALPGFSSAAAQQLTAIRRRFAVWRFDPFCYGPANVHGSKEQRRAGQKYAKVGWIGVRADIGCAATASAITAEVARACDAAVGQGLSAQADRNPAAGSLKGTAKDKREYFQKCVANQWQGR